MPQTDALGEVDQHHHHHHHQPQTSSNPNLPTPQEFHGIGWFLGKRSVSLGGGISIHHHQIETEGNSRIIYSANHTEDMWDDEDGWSQAGGEKKRRLNSEQVKLLEKNFEVGNKLEPDRKLYLASSLGLQPRQIAIWFQNRRVRWKTKQLENDYQLLKRQFDAIKAQNSTLQSHNTKLRAQIMALKSLEPAELINLNKKTDGSGSCSNTSGNCSDINLDISRRTQPAINSNPNITSRSSPLFQSNDSKIDHPNTNVVDHLFENPDNTSVSLSSATHDIQPQKVDHCHHHHLPQTVKEESFSNMLCGIDDQAEFWPWLE